MLEHGQILKDLATLILLYKQLQIHSEQGWPGGG